MWGINVFSEWPVQDKNRWSYLTGQEIYLDKALLLEHRENPYILEQEVYVFHNMNWERADSVPDGGHGGWIRVQTS